MAKILRLISIHLRILALYSSASRCKLNRIFLQLYATVNHENSGAHKVEYNFKSVSATKKKG